MLSEANAAKEHALTEISHLRATASTSSPRCMDINKEETTSEAGSLVTNPTTTTCSITSASTANMVRLTSQLSDEMRTRQALTSQLAKLRNIVGLGLDALKEEQATSERLRQQVIQLKRAQILPRDQSDKGHHDPSELSLPPDNKDTETNVANNCGVANIGHFNGAIQPVNGSSKVNTSHPCLDLCI
ncbi:unnamed protein product [Protopolystoma xenopodis]|uniref:Uncharacterized protein n=1 Tax=Protopolystoma xenopodis TaxID=117903 RepID=A0A448X8V0_9PLAT|nr:unnamed protein product [Protopolystoma xenopodis]